MYSDYQNISHVANVPFLLAKVIKPEMDQKTGSEKRFELNVYKSVVTGDPNAACNGPPLKTGLKPAARSDLLQAD